MVSHETISLNEAKSGLKLAVDASVGGVELSAIEAHIEHILIWAHDTFGAEPLVEKKERFYEETGKVFSDDSFFDARMSYFIDRFIFTCPVDQENSLTPFESFKIKNPEHSPIETTIHSIFKIQKISNRGLLLKDLITQSAHSIDFETPKELHGISKGDLLQGFVYDTGDKKHLSRGLIFHPKEVRTLITKSIKQKTKENQLDVKFELDMLASQQLRHTRHPHVKAKTFYLQQPS